MSSKPLVYVLDDDPEVREALRLTVGMTDYDVACFADGRDFLENFDESRVGCLVVDLRMPGMSGLDVLDALVARGQRIPAIMISGHGDIPAAVRAMKSGAVDFLEKPYSLKVFRESLRRAIATDIELKRDHQKHSAIRQRLSALSPQEREILNLTAAGKPDKAIAGQLGLSIRTIQLRRAALMQKLNVKNRAELIKLASLGTDS